MRVIAFCLIAAALGCGGRVSTDGGGSSSGGGSGGTTQHDAGATDTSNDGGQPATGDGSVVCSSSGSSNSRSADGGCSEPHAFGVCGETPYDVICECPAGFCLCTKNGVHVGMVQAPGVCTTCQADDGVIACGFPSL